MASPPEYDPDYESTLDPNTRIPRRHTGPTSYAVGQTNSARKRSKTVNYSQSAPRSSLPSVLSDVKVHLESIKKGLNKSRYDEELSLRVLHAALTMQKEYLESEQRKKTKKGAAVRTEICKLFGISPVTYSAIVNDYFAEVKTVYESSRQGNFNAKTSRLPNTKQVEIDIREFVRERRQSRQRTTAVQVLDFCQTKGYITIEQGEDGPLQKDYKAALRSVQRWLRKHDYRRGRRSGNVLPKEHVQVARDLYLAEFFANREKPPQERLREVYMDESYIHQHYKKEKDSLWDPNDEQDIQTGKSPAKGRRFCFACAIQGPDPRVFTSTAMNKATKEEFLEAKREDKATLADMLPSERGGVVPGTVWYFSPTSKKMHTGDYHKVFSGENFLTWWKEQLLPNLHQPSLIIMDNASYHCTLPADVPKYNSRKAVMQEYLRSKGLTVLERETKPLLRSRIKAYVAANVKLQTVRLAEEAGHRVLFTPPYHSDFQPIELLWAKIKGNIGRQYSNDTTMQVLQERLKEQFEAAMSWRESTEGFIRKAAKTALDFHNQTISAEAAGIGEDTDDEVVDFGSMDDDSSADEGTNMVQVSI